MDTIINALTQIDAVVWGPAMICLLLGSHIFLTIRTGFIQRKLPTAIKMSLAKDEDAEGDVSQFGALVTALAGTIGTGSIVGVATAIIAGGPGAVFWMWLTGVFGIATKYCEVFASVKYRVKDHKGEMLGGAMYAWERAFKRSDGSVPWWAKLGAVAFAAFAVIATIGTGSAVQSAAITGIIESSFPGVPDWAIALVIAIAVALVIFGGVKSISSVAEKLVPFMAIAYFGGCMVILAINWQYVGPALAMIFECAFTSKAAFGGAVGSGIMVALQFGCARGLFSNESGLGSAPSLRLLLHEEPRTSGARCHDGPPSRFAPLRASCSLPLASPIPASSKMAALRKAPRSLRRRSQPFLDRHPDSRARHGELPRCTILGWKLQLETGA